MKGKKQKLDTTISIHSMSKTGQVQWDTFGASKKCSNYEISLQSVVMNFHSTPRGHPRDNTHGIFPWNQLQVIRTHGIPPILFVSTGTKRISGLDARVQDRQVRSANPPRGWLHLEQSWDKKNVDLTTPDQGYQERGTVRYENAVRHISGNLVRYKEHSRTAYLVR